MPWYEPECIPMQGVVRDDSSAGDDDESLLLRADGSVRAGENRCQRRCCATLHRLDAW